MGLLPYQDSSWAAHSETSDAQEFVVVGADIPLERESWWLEIQYPVDNYENTTSGYGWRDIPGCKRCSEFHRGLDFTPGVGSPVYAIMDGVVSQVEHAGEYGVHVIITHE